jgi:hypothetical protein
LAQRGDGVTGQLVIIDQLDEHVNASRITRANERVAEHLPRTAVATVAEYLNNSIRILRHHNRGDRVSDCPL